MTKNGRIASYLAGLIGLAATSIALATPIDITVQANLNRDLLSGSVFGYTDFSVPIVISFSLDSDDPGVQTRPPGTPIVTDKFFNSTIQLVSGAALTNFSAAIGNQTFSSDDLVHQILGTSGMQYDMVLVGNLTDGGLSSVQFDLQNGTGELDLGVLNCSGAGCAFQNVGTGTDFNEFGNSTLSDITVSSHLRSVPVAEPASVGLLGAGIAGLFGFRRRRARAAG